jgi:hypothetical protein
MDGSVSFRPGLIDVIPYLHIHVRLVRVAHLEERDK